MYYASQHRDRLDRLVLIDPAPTNPDLLIESYRVLIDRIGSDEWRRLEEIYDRDAYLAGDPAAHNEAMRLSEGATFHVAAAREQYFDIVAFDAVTARNMVAISGPAQSIKSNVAVEADLDKISCPTLIVFGAEDFIVPVARERIHQLIPDSRLVVIPDSGHYPFMEQPETFTRTLRAFILETRDVGEGAGPAD